MNKTRIILIIASSLDGRIAFPDGGPSHLGSLEDKKILNDSLSKVDATIFGSGTLKAHKSTYLIKNSLTKNNFKSKKNQPISIVAGDSNKFSGKWNYFAQPIKRWLISSSTERNDENKINFDKQFIFKESWRETLKVIYKEGIQTIGLLGGTKLITSFASENLIDEIKITIVPNIIGGKYSWISLYSNDLIYKLGNKWSIKNIKALDTNEIFVHYAKKSDFY